MAKFHGIIGYGIPEETRPGVWTEKIIERNSTGDVERSMGNWSTQSDSTNDDFNINNQISIISDPFAYQHFQYMKYIEFMGAKWKIKSAEVKYPRIILSVGGVYNGQ